jgi:hypothetical protein
MTKLQPCSLFKMVMVSIFGLPHCQKIYKEDVNISKFCKYLEILKKVHRFAIIPKI